MPTLNHVLKVSNSIPSSNGLRSSILIVCNLIATDSLRSHNYGIAGTFPEHNNRAGTLPMYYEVAGTFPMNYDCTTNTTI